MARREGRFLRWYRLLPLLTLAGTLGLCGALDAAPTTLGRQLLYPVSDVAAIEASAARHGVDPDLVCAVIKCESSWNPTATSSAGAIGLMQVMPDTARSLVEMGLVDGSACVDARLMGISRAYLAVALEVDRVDALLGVYRSLASVSPEG